MKMTAESSIYWGSGDSRRSISGSSGSCERHYIDPWDLENYAYLRRHSVANVPRRTRHPTTHGRSFRDARARSEYWYASSQREPRYDNSSYAQELYRVPVRPRNNGFYYQQAIYEDEGMEHTAQFPLYAPMLEMSSFPPQEEKNLPIHIKANEERYIIEAISSPYDDLNTDGYMKFDYTNSWNSLNRRISK